MCFDTKWEPILTAFVKGFETEDAMETHRYEKTGQVLVEIVFSSDNGSNAEDNNNSNRFDISDDETRYSIRLNRTHFGGSKSSLALPIDNTQRSGKTKKLKIIGNDLNARYNFNTPSTRL